MPPDRLAVVKVAVPALSRLAVPSVLVPSRKATFPAGEPPPGGTARTTAVKVTGRPKIDRLAEEVTVAVVAARLTVCVKPPR